MIDWFSFLKIKERANKRAGTWTDGFSQRLLLWPASLAQHRFSHPSLLLEGNLDEDAVNHGATVREAAIGTHTYEQYRRQSARRARLWTAGGGEAGGGRGRGGGRGGCQWRETHTGTAGKHANKQETNLAAAKELFFLFSPRSRTPPPPVPEFVLRRRRIVKGELCKQRPLQKARRGALALAAAGVCGAKRCGIYCSYRRQPGEKSPKPQRPTGASVPTPGPKPAAQICAAT